MLSQISWSSFLIFLAAMVVVYYGVLLGIWFLSKPKRSAPAPEKKGLVSEPGQTPVSVSPPQGMIDLTQETLYKELRRWLYWSNHQPFNRRQLLGGIENHLREFKSERLAMTREQFDHWLHQTTQATGAITLTEEETEQLWNASAAEPSFSFLDNSF